METETGTLEVTPYVSNLRRTIESTNIVEIFIEDVVEELIYDERGLLLYQDSVQTNCRIRLQPRNFTPDHIAHLLVEEDIPYSQYLGEDISTEVNGTLADDNTLREPIFVTIFADFRTVRRMVLPPEESAPSGRGASEYVLGRLVEEQRVESTDLEDGGEVTCSICFENLSENIIRMPRCLHMFHQACLFAWLGRHNSCPLCRRVPYDEDIDWGLELQLGLRLDDFEGLSIS